MSLLVIFWAHTDAQRFTGFVKKNDSLSSPIYQAKVEIFQEGQSIRTVKTYFDGGFQFTPDPNQIYSFRISYPGYADTAITITTDKKAHPTPAQVTVKLKKDGMRLLGVVKSSDDDFPIKDVTVTLKNIMTRKENRQTTGIDGYYNFKLEYETNYRVSIDNRSTGVFNKYLDTTFYVSTIGFNQPLDYKLDIILSPDLDQNTTMPPGYDAEKVTGNSELKPVVSVSNINLKPVIPADSKQENTAANAQAPQDGQKLKVAEDTIAKLQAELQAAKNDLANEKALKETLAQLRLEQHRIAPQVSTKKAYDDSVAKVHLQQKHLADVRAAQKTAQDSITKVRAANQKMIDDSVKVVHAEQKHLAYVRAAQKAAQDSITKVRAISHQKMVDDSVKDVRVENHRIAQEVVAQKTYRDSVAKALADTRQKMVQDSIRHLKR